jgi:uncharacterized protein
MSPKFLIIVLAILIPALGTYAYLQKEGITMSDIFNPGVHVVNVGGIPMSVVIADTPELRTQGLSGRREIGATGMLFVFDTDDYHGIWMKDMLFPIDLIWIDKDLTVIDVERGVRPDTYPRTYRPQLPARYLIETTERFTETFGIGIGDEVTLPKKLVEKL